MIYITFGVISGIITCLGMGGGAILTLLLSLFANMNQHLAQGTNIIFFIPTSIAAIIMNSKYIDYKKAQIIITFGIIGAIIGCKMSFLINNSILKKLFGIFLILIAIFEIFTLFRQYIKSKNER